MTTSAIQRKPLEQQYAESLAGHELTVVADTPLVKCFRMAKPGTRVMSVVITFTPEGIVIQGDFTPERNGSVSCIGYSLAWFAGRLGGSYLCEKFLTQRYVLELAVAELRDPQSHWREDATPDQLAGLDECARRVADYYYGPERLYDALADLGYPCDEGTPGFNYDPKESAALHAIQKRFSQLYHQNFTTPGEDS